MARERVGGTASLFPKRDGERDLQHDVILFNRKGTRKNYTQTSARESYWGQGKVAIVRKVAVSGFSTALYLLLTKVARKSA